MRKRFASYLLTGKVAANPFLTSKAFADVTPTFSELTSSSVSVIEQPVANQVRLLTTTAGAPYGSASGSAAYACSSPLPSTMNVVVTGLQTGEQVYLVASTAKDTGEFAALNSSIRVGNAHLTIIAAFTVNNATIAADASDITRLKSTATVPLDLNRLASHGFNVSNGSVFYLQAVAFPSVSDPVAFWAQARVSELDEIKVTTQGCSPYGY
jgi:hypothetical protein